MSMATDDSPAAAASGANLAQPHRPSIPVWCSSTSTVPLGDSDTKSAAGSLMPSPVSTVTVASTSVRCTSAQWSVIDIEAWPSLPFEPSSEPASGSSLEQPASSTQADIATPAHRSVPRTRST